MCGCRKDKKNTFVWTSKDGSQSKTYNDRMQVRAKIIHEEMKNGKGNGGSFVTV